MSTVRKIDESNRQIVVEAARSDVVKHVFAFYDLQHDPEHTVVYASFRDDRLEGYTLIYTALTYPSVILECAEDVAEKLLTYLPETGFIMHAPPNLLAVIKRKLPSANIYVEDWMLVRKGEAKCFRSDRVRRLRTADDGSKLAALLSTRVERQRAAETTYLDWVEKMPMYGVFVNDELVAYAGSFIQTPEIWMIGGVYTNPMHRNKGYATLATSAVTEEALAHAEMAALFVRSDNAPAVRAYERIGFSKIGEKLWVDVGTGLKP